MINKNRRVTQDRLDYVEELSLRLETIDLRVNELKQKKKDLYKQYGVSKYLLKHYKHKFEGFKLK